MTFAIKKRINTELFIDDQAALSILNSERNNGKREEGVKSWELKNNNWWE